MYAKVLIAGHLGQDPEMRYTPSGSAVTNFSVATNRVWNNAEGEKQEETVWFRVSCWNRLAEITNEYLQKGRAVLIEGRLRPDPNTGGPRIWTGNDGEPRANFELTASTVKFLGGGNGGSRVDQGEDPKSTTEDHPSVPF